MTLGENLIKVRKAHGLNRQQLADEFEMPSTTLRNYEKGDREPGHEFLIKFSKRFHVSIDWLVGNAGPDENKSPDPSNDGPRDQDEVAIMRFVEGLTADQKELLISLLTTMTVQNQRKLSSSPAGADAQEKE